MAVSIDTVYQRVLALVNKEQRGYITPQEFNLLANQAQMSIFESYFYSKNQRERLEADRDDSSEANVSNLLDAKLRPFMSNTALTSNNGGDWSYPTTAYQTGDVYYSSYVCNKLSANEIRRQKVSLRHFGREPAYCDNATSSGDIHVIAMGVVVTSGVTCDIVSKPADVAWGYVVINDKALYNVNTTVNFQLHESEEDTLVTAILELSGIVVNKPGLVNIASTVNSNEKQIQSV